MKKKLDDGAVFILGVVAVRAVPLGENRRIRMGPEAPHHDCKRNRHCTTNKQKIAEIGVHQDFLFRINEPKFDYTPIYQYLQRFSHFVLDRIPANMTQLSLMSPRPPAVVERSHGRAEAVVSSSPEEVAELVFSKISDLHSQVPWPHLQSLRSRLGTHLTPELRLVFAELVLVDLMQVVDPKRTFVSNDHLVEHVVRSVLCLDFVGNSQEILEAIGWYMSWQSSYVR